MDALLDSITEGNGKLLDNPINERVASAPIPPRDSSVVIGIAKGKRKFRAIRAAISGHQVNGLITDEETAEFLLTN